MSRDDAVLLVSRAIAVIQLICAFVDASYLPERFVSLHHYSIAGLLSLGDTYFANLDRVEIGFHLGRIAGYFFASWIFWNCGPRISRILLPSRKEEGTARQAE